MDEQKELRIKNRLVEFIKDNFIFEGETEPIKDKVITITDNLFELCRVLFTNK